MAINDESYSPTSERHSSKGETPSQPSQTERAITWLVGVSKLLAAVIAIGGPGFALGRLVEEAKGHEAVAAIRAELTMKTAALESANIDLTARASAYQTLQQQLIQKDAQVTRLTEASKRGRDCDYLRQQIELTKRDLAHEQYPLVIQFDIPKSEQRDKETIDRLETRLSRYVSQFSTCTKSGA